MAVCVEPGCPNLTPCTRHGKRPRDKRRPNSTARGYDRRWARTRSRYLRSHPDCERCGQPAVDVHHRDELGPLGPAGHDHDNLEALCHRCHSQHTARGQARAR